MRTPETFEHEIERATRRYRLQLAEGLTIGSDPHRDEADELGKHRALRMAAKDGHELERDGRGWRIAAREIERPR